MVIYLGGGKEGLKRIEDTKNIFTVVQGRKVSTWTGDWIGRKIKKKWFKRSVESYIILLTNFPPINLIIIKKKDRPLKDKGLRRKFINM